MAKDFAQSFYNSTAWKKCRDEYRKKAHNLCERCLANGMFCPGDIVHHKIHINGSNITNPAITLNFDNLELLCRDCHADEHASKKKYANDRYHIDEKTGKVFSKDED